VKHNQARAAGRVKKRPAGDANPAPSAPDGAARPDSGAGAGHSAGQSTFPIVGVGASAGGLEAFTSLLRHLDGHSGMALVLIQHLDPTHTSYLREALANATKLPVLQAEEGMCVEPDHVYVIPPNKCLGIHDGRLTLIPRPEDPKAQNLPIDLFFRELAVERGSRAIGVVLSGTASDGTEGLKAIKEACGITFAQDPASAKFSEMPRRATDAGVVDFSLPIPELAQELMRLGRHPYVVAPESTPSIHDAATLQQIFEIVQHATRVDFSEYKSPNFDRRLARRMALRRVDTLAAYLTVLQDTPAEVVALHDDALIHVTSFFRDPEVFESLKASVFPAIIAAKPDDAPIRMWVAGCATGEEVYSLAIALVEVLGRSSRPIQLFGSDVSSKVIEVARAGFYPDSALREVSEERRSRYFTKVERGYRIVKSIRDLCVFVQHDLARDPPFSRLDLASCRNVLIYFDQPLQRRVIPMFHYALAQPGFLLLGRAEHVAGFKQLFDEVDKTNKIFARTATHSTLRFARRTEVAESPVSPRVVERAADEGRPGDLSTRLDRLLIARYVPPGVVVNERMEILQFRGQTGAYLQPAPGAPQHNLMQMARDGLHVALRATVAEARKGSVPVRTCDVEVDQDGYKRTCDVVVIPLKGAPDALGALYVILFEEHPRTQAAGRPSAGLQSAPETTLDRARVPKLEEELAAAREYLQSVIDEHGRANEDLGTANEELVSGNEELQSMNEELETAKEELQSINEELTTVNDELQSRNHEVTQVNSDLVNLLTTVDIPILFLDSERRIRRFTPKARRILNVLTGDIGRPFEDIRPNIDVVDLDHQIAEVIETMIVKESEVQDRDGRWYRLQIRPYKTTDNRIDGAIVSLFDIDALKHLIDQAQQANSDAERANRTKDEFLATLSHELRTPLSSMLMRAQLLKRGGMDDFKVKRAGEAIEAGVKMQVQLIDDLLDISRIVAGTLHLDLQPIDLAQVVTTAIESLNPSITRRSLDLGVALDTGGTMAMVFGDEARLQQVVTNLLTNAIKFTPERGAVSVSLALADGNVVLSVKDSGMGIDPGFLPNMFNRFTQQDSTTTRAYGGLGLGLAIVRHLVELHHGTVRAESPGSGKGATFSVTLPRIKALRFPVPGEAPAPERSAIDAAVLHGLRILVLDDDRATCEAIADLLGQAGADVRSAQSGADAMRLVDAFHPSMLICDIAMPGENGYAFLRKLRAHGEESANIPALALTALAGDEDRERALASGFQIHLAKPVDIDCLTDAVLALAAGRVAPPCALPPVQP
jgi:two-component system CheB/CheR fusion protein